MRLRNRGFRSFAAVLIVASAVTFSAVGAWVQSSFVVFESGHVRPIILSPDGSQVFAVNTPDNTLEIFNIGAGGLTFAGSVPVLGPLSALVLGGGLLAAMRIGLKRRGTTR